MDRPNTIVLPALTFCSQIGVKKSVLADVSGMEGEFIRPPSRQLQETLEKLYRNFIHSFPVQDILHYAPKFEDFILETKCLTDEMFNRTFCKNLGEYALNSLHELEACWTLFHRLTANPMIDDADMQLNEERAEAMVMINEKTVLAGPREVEFEPGELMRFTLDLMEDQSPSLHLPVTATLRVHDSDRIASRDSDVPVLIASNLHYRITAIEKKYVTLPAPYPSECFHYYEGDEKNISIYNSNYTRSHFDCISSCLAKETQRRCSCWPPEVAYVTLDQSTTNRSTMCDWVDMAKASRPDDFLTNDTSSMLKKNFEIARAASDVFNNCTGDHIAMCNELCPHECIYSDYDVRYETNKWPEDESLDHVHSSHAHSSDVEDLALVSLIRDDYVIQMESVPIYDFLSTLSSAGGIFALWIGFTFAAVVDQMRAAIILSYNSLKRFSSDG